MKPFIWIIDEEWPDYRVEEAILKERYPECTIKYSTYEYMNDLAAFGYKADFVICQVYASIPREVIRRLVNCKGIAVYGGGYDRVDVTAAREMGISVTNVSDYCKEDLADYVMASIYHFNKQLLTFEERMKSGLWGAQAVQNPIRRIKGSTLLVIGLGRIGKTVAEKAKGLGMKVVAFDPFIDKEIMLQLGIVKVEWVEGLESADYISVNAILNKDTQGLLKYADFLKMKQSAYLVNTARGKIIVENDLIRAVEEGLIAGAALDVIEVEPPTLNEAVFQCKGIMVTPHISYISEESYAELKRRSVQNAIDMYEGRIPADLVN
jgi:phosphoglycerate dehydrogenase-like enzyme